MYAVFIKILEKHNIVIVLLSYLNNFCELSSPFHFLFVLIYIM